MSCRPPALLKPQQPYRQYKKPTNYEQKSSTNEKSMYKIWPPKDPDKITVYIQIHRLVKKQNEKKVKPI